MDFKCEIIEDLLPLYFDGLCSRETERAVEEHFKCCESCKLMLTEIFLDSVLCE